MSEAYKILKSSYISKPVLIAALVIFILSGPSCSVKKNNILSREFHKTLAHYNGYFNAREKVREGAKTLYSGEIDRYDRILSVFKYGTEAQAKAIFPEMDEAIKKVSIVIQRHSMEIDGKERNKWIEDCYLLIGTAQFYKHDTWTAIESFQYVAAQYRSEPIRFDALLGLSHCYLRLGKMPDADYLLSTMKDDKELPVNLKAHYNATYANYYLLQNDLEKAAEHLEKAKAMTKKRAERYRYAFILGQIYQKLEKHPEAVTQYDQVIKLSPPYEMAFNARVNRARSVDVNSADGKEIRKMLEKMLRDEKNTEYQDQIYYALAEISLKENNVPQAIDLLKQSVASSVSNTNQKALSFLKLAELNFKKPDYKLAQMYYDSTAATISEDHPDYLSIINTKNNLNKLIYNLNIIQTEDSLQALAAKTAGERELIISRMIDEENQAKERARIEKKEREAAEKEAKEQMEANPSFNQQENRPGGATSPSGAGWYFSNPSAISFGFNEFIRMWGNRKLEDNWRRSTRTSFAEAEGPDETMALLDSTEFLDAATRDSILALDNAKRKAAYTSTIPVTPEQKAKSDEKIVEAYYNVGVIYKEQLKDNKESGKNFETLLQRYPENDYKIPTIYNLYRVNLAMGDEEKANYYKNIILTQYPETEYAKIILNPDYYKDQQRKVAIQKVFYENTYRAYLNKQYEDVIERKAMADSLFPASDLAPKFEFLRAMAIGKSRTVPEFEAALKGVVAHYPNDTVSVRAKEILAMINPSMYGREISEPKPAAGTPSNVVEAPKAKTAFVFSPDTLQYVIFIYANNVIGTNEFKIAISNYNNKYYSIKKLQISSSFVGQENQMMMIRQFTGKQEGLSYLNGLLSDPEALSEIDISTARYFTITPDNLLLLMQTKDIDGYDAFYEEKYLN